jgi:acyl carrier protein
MDQLRDLVARVFDIPKNQVTDNLQRGKIEAWDSLNHLLLISEIENEFGIQFTTDEVLEIKTFKDIEAIVLKRRNNRTLDHKVED